MYAVLSSFHLTPDLRHNFLKSVNKIIIQYCSDRKVLLLFISIFFCVVFT